MSIPRMQVDVGWAYNRKVRKLQRLYPDRWPVYWAAYMALLGEVWQRGRDGRRLTVLDAWCPALPAEPAEALAALVAAGVTDRAGRIPAASWKEWIEPVLAVLEAKRAGGQLGAEKRWRNGTGNGTPNRTPNGEKRREIDKPRRAQAHAGARGGPPVDAAEIMRANGASWLVDKEANDGKRTN